MHFNWVNGLIVLGIFLPVLVYRFYHPPMETRIMDTTKKD